VTDLAQTQPRGALVYRMPLPLAAGTSLVVLSLIAVGDWLSDRRLNLVIISLVPILIAAMSLRTWLLWSTFAGAAFIAVGLFVLIPPGPIPGVEFHLRVLNRGLLCLSLLVLTAVLHAFIRIYRQLEVGRLALAQRGDELSAINAALRSREEENARQNEELQNQTEELERQSEKLRHSNDQLARREKMLEALLSLARALSASSTRAETMDRICQSLGGLINGPHTAAAIKERDGDQIRIVCHSGFGPDGPEEITWPYNRSFASLVLDRGQTGHLEDVSLRPDLRIPQPKNGPRLRSVLAAPLRVGGRAVGSLEVLHTERHVWTEEQVKLIESLAAQTSISLEAAELFERVEEERQRLETLLEHVPFAIWIANHDCTDVRVNPAGAALLDVPPGTPLDRAYQEARWRVHRDGKPIDFEQRPLMRACRRGEIVSNEELEIVFPSGRRVTVLASAAPIRGRGDGRIVGAVSGWAEVTQLKALQAELDARRCEAEESSVRKSRFLAAVSHDIRTPANAISLLAELMQRTAANPTLVGQIPEVASDLKRSALTLVDLVSDVLDLTRFDSGKIELHESEFELADLMNEECRQYHEVARDKGLLFDCHLPDPSLVVRADRVKLSRILGNLIGNAIKFTETGGVRVSAERDADGRVALRVSDTGPGIPPEHHERIFDEFFQLKNTDPGRSKGSGLGLAICRRLAEAMGGTITLDSAPGKGSTFTVFLPARSVLAA
jgi:signal transduction histidine kinase